MRRILAVLEAVDDTAPELAAVGRSLGAATVTAAACGRGVAAGAAALAAWFDEVLCFEDERCAAFDGDLVARVLAPWIERERPWATLLAHTNNGLELAPLLAARCGVPLLADCFALDVHDGRLAGTRALYGGKVHARVVAARCAAGYMATLRPGACAASAAPLPAPGVVRLQAVAAELVPRRKLVATVAPEPGAADIAAAERLVGVGRGIGAAENLGLVRSLAEALGAEIACTRPVVDRKWLEKSRQVGTSGRTVKPKLYFAVGLSGSFQHLAGIRGRPFVAAINKDPAAPIFGAATVGIVGDLFDLVPLFERKIRERKG